MQFYHELALQLTWLAEGTVDQCKYIHWPGGGSGVTWGKGFDVSLRSPANVLAILQGCKIAADWFAQAAGLTGEPAKAFVNQNRDRQVLSEEEMSALFFVCWDEQMTEVERICSKADVVAKYGSVDLDKVDPRIVVMLGDLKYRGDYTPNLRAVAQRYVVINNRAAFTAALKTVTADWPADRTRRRFAFLEGTA
jgi:hypothetical protein